VAARDELVRLCVVEGRAGAAPSGAVEGRAGAAPSGAVEGRAGADAAPLVLPDVAGKLGGRGVWVCPKRACVRNAVRKGGLARAAGRSVSGVDVEALTRAMADQLGRRVTGLLASAARTRRVAMGTDATKQAIETGSARLLVVAEDAAGRREELEAAAGRLEQGFVVFGTKASLGAFFGRAEVGVLAILDAGIAAELARAAERAAALSEDG
jgi:ribosomal protein L7Ae-like RNA K-turn-binding protein